MEEGGDGKRWGAIKSVGGDAERFAVEKEEETGINSASGEEKNSAYQAGHGSMKLSNAYTD